MKTIRRQPLFWERPFVNNNKDFIRPPRCLRRIIGRLVRRARLAKQPYFIYKGRAAPSYIRFKGVDY